MASIYTTTTKPCVNLLRTGLLLYQHLEPHIRCQNDCGGLTRPVAQHHTVLCALPPSQCDGEENWEKKQSTICGLKKSYFLRDIEETL